MRAFKFKTDMETREDTKKTYYIATSAETLYVTYDSERLTAELRGCDPVTLPHERFADFLHTARLLGLTVGEL